MYAAVDQAVGALHTMAVLQAYQADLLKDLDQGKILTPETVLKLCRATDLDFCATKQMACVIGPSITAMVAMGGICG